MYSLYINRQRVGIPRSEVIGYVFAYWPMSLLFGAWFEKVIVTRTCGIPHGDRKNFGKTPQTFVRLSSFLAVLNLQFVSDKVVKLYVFNMLLFSCWFSLLFSKYINSLYLLKHSVFVNRELLANLVYLYIMKTIIIIISYW